MSKRLVGGTKGCKLLKKNLNASRPSEHHPVKRENAKTFRWDHRLQRQTTSSRPLNGFIPLFIMVVTLCQQYDVGEKPTVKLYTLQLLFAMQGYQTKNKNKTKQNKTKTYSAS